MAYPGRLPSGRRHPKGIHLAEAKGRLNCLPRSAGSATVYDRRYTLEARDLQARPGWPRSLWLRAITSNFGGPSPFGQPGDTSVAQRY